jgi:hypothetical protein
VAFDPNSSQVAAASTSSEVDARYDTSVQMSEDVAAGKQPTTAQLIATMATAVTLVGGPVVGGAFIVGMTALFAFTEAFMWVADKLGIAAKAGPGWCADLNRVPTGPDDPRWQKYPYGGVMQTPVNEFERFAFPLVAFDDELGNNCRQNVLTPPVFQQLVAFYNSMHVGPTTVMRTYGTAAWGAPRNPLWEWLQAWKNDPIVQNGFMVNQGMFVAPPPHVVTVHVPKSGTGFGPVPAVAAVGLGGLAIVALIAAVKGKSIEAVLGGAWRGLKRAVS